MEFRIKANRCWDAPHYGCWYVVTGKQPNEKYLWRDLELHGYCLADGYFITEQEAEDCLRRYKEKNEMNKDTNPKDALGIKKVPMHSVPCGPLMELSLAMMEGGRKYGSHNYRKVGCRASVYYDAIERHIKAWWEGEDIDPDSGLHHLIKAMACCTVMRDSMLMKNWIDDRPIRYPDGLDIDGYNKQAAELINRYPDCKEPFTEKGRKYPKPLINKLKQFEATIECVPTYGWQIKLVNGKFLMAFKHLACVGGMCFQETSTPFYYSTKPEAEVWLDRYLRG